MNRENRADEELKVGMYKEFDSIKELIDDLHIVPYFCCPWCRLIFYPETPTAIHCVAQ